MANEKYIAALDVGTTTLRCFIYNTALEVKGFANDQILLVYPEPGHVEIEPEQLWESCVNTINAAIKKAGLTPQEISCIGLSTQKNSILTWDKETGETFHNFIIWKDLRSTEIKNHWNHSVIFKAIKAYCFAAYSVTRNNKYLAASTMKFMCGMAMIRLIWVINNNEKLKKAIKKKTALYGTIDSWLLYRLKQGTDRTKQVEHVTDITSASTSGFYDSYNLEWSPVFMKLFSIKAEILPKVVDNNYNFGFIDKSIFGCPIRIGTSLSDQSAGMWGACCFNKGDAKLTLGTAAVFDFNCGDQSHTSVKNFYPIIAWSLDGLTKSKTKNLIYGVEGAVYDNGSIIKWAINFGLFTDPAKSSDIANSVPDSDGCFFVPAFSGLGIWMDLYRRQKHKGLWKRPPNDDIAPATGILGLRPSTKNEHIVRAVLESLVFRIVQLYGCSLRETKFAIKTIKVDGGVAKNDFVCQLLADLTGRNVERSETTEMSALGAGFLAGLNLGIWKSTDDLIKLRKVEKVFFPRKEYKNAVQLKMAEWERAVERFKRWYD